jgi:hypothetical protein
MLTSTDARIPSEQELDNVSHALTYMSGEVEGVAIAITSLKRAEINDGEALPQVDAAAAWHLHTFARDCRTTAEHIVKWANEIEEAADWLYHEGGDRARLESEQFAEHYNRLADFFERKAQDFREPQ